MNSFVAAAAGQPVPVLAEPTVADGIAVRPSRVTSPSASCQMADRVVTVSEERPARGLLLCLERAKQVMESAGAAGVAALFEHSREFRSPGGGGAVRRQHQTRYREHVFF